MREPIKRAFDSIQAGDELKEETMAVILSNERTAKKPAVRRWALAAACALLLIVFGGVSYRVYMTPSSFVDIDVNPSIELTLNSFGRVIGANAYNEDGETIIAGTNILHKSYDQALALLLSALLDAGYLQSDELLSVTVQADKNGDKLLSTVQNLVRETAQADNLRAEQEVYAVDEDTKNHAHQWGVSPARYLAIRELQEVDPTATAEQCHGQTISEIRQETESHRHGQANGGQNSETKQNGENGHHGGGNKHQ